MKQNLYYHKDIWERDKGICQNCDKKLYKSINPYEETLNFLKMVKEIKIYKVSWECWKCKEETTIVSYCLRWYHSFTIGELQKLDKLLMEHYPFVKKVFSKTRGEKVIANICIHCKALQGNWFVWEHFLLDYSN